MIAESLVAVIAVGLLVGGLSSRLGTGVGLSLPILAVLGVPLPSALLATKLAACASDAADARFASMSVGLPVGLPRGVAAAVAGALGAFLVAAVPGMLAYGLVSIALLAIAVGLARAGARPAATAWSAYIGACGIGFGLMRHWGARSRRGFPVNGRAIGASANLGAVVVLVAAGHAWDTTTVVLALAQAAGSAVVARAMRPIAPT